MFRSYEEPSYEVERRIGEVEVRRYAPMVVAETTVSGDPRESLSEGFRRIAGYIFGGNDGGREIAMTTPVARRPDRQGAKIAMTAPVARRPDGDRYVVSFVMPAGSALETLPTPNDDRVTLRRQASRRVAALRFSGWAREARVRDQERTMLRALEDANLTPASPPELAQYDPPWTLPFLRRNEILVELE